MKDSDHHCAGCPIDVGRRTFLRDAAAAAVAAFTLLGATADLLAAAAPLSFTTPSRSLGETRSYPIPGADGAAIDRDAEVILVRWQGYVYAFNLACPHKKTALRWLPNDGRFQCPKHRSKYRPDGSFIEGKATRGMDRFSVRREGSTVVVDLEALHEQDGDAAGWGAARAAV